jgi:hypothetical protein
MRRTSKYQKYLQSAEIIDREERANPNAPLDERAAHLRELADALPAAPPRRQLIHRSVLTIGIAVVPLVLWGVGFAAFPILLLYWGEGWCMAIANVARILFTSSSAEGPRASVAVRYALLFAVPWTAFGALFWGIYAPDQATRALLVGRHWGGLADHVLAQHLGWPLAVTAAGLAIQVAQASGYIDAYLVFGARTVARYGYGRIFAAFILLFLAPGFFALGDKLPLTMGSEGQRAALVLVLFIAGVRLILHVADLWFPIWGRGMLRSGAAIATSAQAIVATSQGDSAVTAPAGTGGTGLPGQGGKLP